MDFSKFSDADFDPKEWVNGALRAHKDARIPVDVSGKGFPTAANTNPLAPPRPTPRHWS